MKSAVLVLAIALCAGCSSGAAGGTAPSSSAAGAGGGTEQTAGNGAGGSGGTAGSSVAGGNGGSSPAGGSAGADSGGNAGTGGAVTAATKTYVYMGSGSWSSDGSGKLLAYAFDEESAALSAIQDLPVGDLNSFGAINATTQHLYVTDEVGLLARAYAVDAQTGMLSFVNQVDTSDGAVFSTLDGSGKFLLVAYYSAGGVEVFALEPDGSIGASVDSETTGAMAHSITLSPDNQSAFVPNKGDDVVSQFSFDATSGTLTQSSPATVASGGDGPRHMTFRPDGLFAYVLNETDSQLTAFDSSAAGTLTSIESISNASGGLGKASSHIHTTPDGKFLYASNRDDDDTIAMYAIESDGTLTSLGHEPSGGETPRHFAIHPTANVLLVGNQEANAVTTFRIQPDGRLDFIETTNVGAPIFWVGFLTVPR